MCFLIPGNQQQTKFKHVLTQSTESLVYVRVWKTIFLQISHKKKKRMSCNFLFFVSPFNRFHCLFLFINATLNYICTHLRRNVLNCWNSVCMCVCECFCFLLLITRGGNATAKAHFGYWIFTQWGFSNALLLFQCNLSSFFACARAISVKGLNLP